MTEAVEGYGVQGKIGTEKETSESATVTLLQWNIWHKADPREVGAHLKEISDNAHVDVVCLQELSQFAANNTGIEDLPQYISEQLGKGTDDVWAYAVAPSRHLDLGSREHTQSQVLTEDGWRVFSERQPSQNYLVK